MSASVLIHAHGEEAELEDAMWDALIDTIDDGRVRQVRILSDEKPVLYAEIVERWRSDDVFRAFFIGILADVPYRAYLWETPPITRMTSTRAFEFVLVDSSALARLIPDPVAFASHFEATDTGVEVVTFPNLGGDAILVAPIPQAPLGAYPHLAAFARTAPTEQQHTFWRTVGSTVADRLADRPLWLSTNGLGVAWLHARLDSRPKYYSFEPYLKNG
jgi:hypothetical protein